MYGTYKLYEKDPSKKELDAKNENELIEFFANYKNRNTSERRDGECIDCESENWYIWRTNDALDKTYWFCTDCYQVKVKAATG